MTRDEDNKLDIALSDTEWATKTALFLHEDCLGYGNALEVYEGSRRFSLTNDQSECLTYVLHEAIEKVRLLRVAFEAIDRTRLA